MAVSSAKSASRPSSFSNALAQAYKEIPRYVQYTSPVPDTAHPTATTLPLNLVLLIVSYLDDIGDIARVIRTSRLMYYLALPQLYERVSLRSYEDLRYVNGRPEGFGGGSPFAMALNGLVTKQHAQLVKHIRLWGKWKEPDEEDYSKGRVPNGTMMLNILLRAAIDKMAKLQTFSWELDCKPLLTVYQGLGARDGLTSLSLRFPTSRAPRPCVVVPPMANLRAFTALDIDPMCHPDDIGLLLLESKKLEDLRLHFSPRLRREAEAILRLDSYFGRCIKAGYRPKLKHIALQNFIGHHHLNHDHVFDEQSCRSVCILDSLGATEGDPRTLYLGAWKDGPVDCPPRHTHVRTNEVAPKFVKFMQASSQVLQSFIVVSARGFHGAFASQSATPTPVSPVSGNTPNTPSPENAALQGPYVDALTHFHGQSLRHLLLPDQWALSQDQVRDIVRGCPHLTQLGFAFGDADHSALRLLMPFLVELQALRVLRNAQLEEQLRLTSHEDRMHHIASDVGRGPHRATLYIGMGDVVYRVGRYYETVRDDGTMAKLREVSMVDRSEVQRFEIWGLDNLDITADPHPTFSP